MRRHDEELVVDARGEAGDEVIKGPFGRDARVRRLAAGSVLQAHVSIERREAVDPRHP